MSAGDREERRRYVEAIVAELRRRVDTVHERQICPKCFAPLGVKCRRVGRLTNVERDGETLTERTIYPARTVKSPHVERLRADGLPER